MTQLRTDFEELCIRLTVESNHKISIVHRKTQNCSAAEFRSSLSSSLLSTVKIEIKQSELCQ